MNPFLKPFFVVILFLSPLQEIPQQVRFKHLSLNDGLSHNGLFFIPQDRDGFMCFGTKDGLNKFDGYAFAVYHHEPNKSNSIDANYITALFTDSLGILWAGAEKGMVSRYKNSSGKYIFRAKASNNDGVWDEAGLSLPIDVLPLWSGTWWAYILYFTLLITHLYLIRKYELNRINIKNQLEVVRIETETLRSLDRIKSRFFTNISHEFRTPLTLISGEAEGLMEILNAEHTRKQISSIDKNARRLLQLINQLLDLSKLEVGKMELHPLQNNLVLFLKNSFYSIENYATKKNIKLLFSSEGENIQAMYDSEKMEKIITNLLYNAMKFTPDNGTISLKVEQIDTKTITITLSDTGIGISEKDLPYIFDRFYQADSDTGAFEGTGIGLALAKELVTLHLGRISRKNVFEQFPTSQETSSPY